MNVYELPGHVLLRNKEVQLKLGLKKSAFHARAKQPGFPKKYPKDNPIGYKLQEIDDYIDGKYVPTEY